MTLSFVFIIPWRSIVQEYKYKKLLAILLLNFEYFDKYSIYLSLRIIMGQTVCLQHDPNDPNYLHHSGNKADLPQLPPNTPKYSPIDDENLGARLSPYVRQKIQTLNAYQIRSTSYSGQKEHRAFRVNSSRVIYQGEWKDKQPHGVGHLYFPDGSYYYGTFAHGFVHGQGRFIYNNGIYYEGQVRHNVAEGKGTLVDQLQNYVYKGQWLNDLPNGIGEQQWSDKSRYKGQFLNGSKHGKGQYKFSDGSFFQGYMRYDKFHGQGRLLNSQGEYNGSFEQGLMQGRGTFKWRDGCFYEGGYLKNRKHGRGRYVDREGRVYEGNWSNGLRHGQGSLTDDVGYQYRGTWNRNTIQSVQN